MRLRDLNLHAKFFDCPCCTERIEGKDLTRTKLDELRQDEYTVIVCPFCREPLYVELIIYLNATPTDPDAL